MQQRKKIFFFSLDFWLSFWPGALLISAIGLSLYFKSIFFQFVYLDDNSLILDNIEFLKNLSNLPQAFLKDVFQADHGLAAYYRPMLTISFMTDAIFSGENPLAYHVSNVFIHLIAAVLLWKTLLMLGYREKISFLLTVIFTVHPTLAQAVSWVPGRNDSILTVFILASLIFFLRYFNRGKIFDLIGSLLFFTLALFTKESAIFMPFFFLLYLWMRKRLNWGQIVLWSVSWFIIFVGWFGLRRIAFAANPMPFSIKDIFWSLLKNSPAAIQMLGKTIFPFNLSVLPNIPDTTFIWGFLAILLILLFLAWEYNLEKFQQRRSLMFLFGFFWFVIFLAPSFIRPDPNIIADFIEHRLYLPIIGLIIFFAESATLNSLNFWRDRNYIFIVLFIIFGLGGINFFHQNNFADRMTFWTNASKNSPSSPLAQRNLGAMYHLDKKLDLAEEYYKKAIKLNDSEPMAHGNIGLIYASRGSFGPAEREYLKEISINPGYDNAHFNLGLLYYAINQKDKAETEWRKTLEINPDYTDAKEALKTIGK